MSADGFPVAMKIITNVSVNRTTFIWNTNSLCQSSPICMIFGMIFQTEIRNPFHFPLRYDEEKNV